MNKILAQTLTIILTIIVTVSIVIIVSSQTLGTNNAVEDNDTTYAKIEMQIDGDAKANISISNKGILADTEGDIKAQSEFKINELQDDCFNCATRSPIENKQVSPQAIVSTATISVEEPIKVILNSQVPYNLRICPSLECTSETKFYPNEILEAKGISSDKQWIKVKGLWVHTEKLFIQGEIDNLPVINYERITPKSTTTSIPVKASQVITIKPTPSVEQNNPIPTPTPTKEYSYALVDEKRYTLDNHSRNDTFTRFWVFINDNNTPTSNVSFIVIHNGTVLTPWNQNEIVSSSTARLTYPADIDSTKNKLVSNAKLEYRNIGSQIGNWSITPIYHGIANGVGVQLAKSVHLTITQEDINNELTEFYLKFNKE